MEVIAYFTDFFQSGDDFELTLNFMHDTVTFTHTLNRISGTGNKSPTDCSQSAQSSFLAMSLAEVQLKAPIFNWTNYVNSRLPDDIQVSAFANKMICI